MVRADTGNVVQTALFCGLDPSVTRDDHVSIVDESWNQEAIFANRLAELFDLLHGMTARVIWVRLQVPYGQILDPQRGACDRVVLRIGGRAAMGCAGFHAPFWTGQHLFALTK